MVGGAGISGTWKNMKMKVTIQSSRSIDANPVKQRYHVPVSRDKVFKVLRPLPNQLRKNRRLLNKCLYLDIMVFTVDK